MRRTAGPGPIARRRSACAEPEATPRTLNSGSFPVVGVAQLVELLVVVQAVAGSSPVAHLHKKPRKRAGQFSAPINLRNLPAGTDQVKITVITTSGSIISGTRTYHACRKRLPFHGPPRL